MIKRRNSTLVSARSLTMSTDWTFLQLELILAKLPNSSARNRPPWWLNTIWHAVKRIKYFNSPHSLPRHQIHRILHQNLLLALHLDLDRPCYLFASWTPAAGHVYIQDACKWRGQSSSIGCSKTKVITLANSNRERQSNEPIEFEGNTGLKKSAGKHVQVSPLRISRKVDWQRK